MHPLLVILIILLLLGAVGTGPWWGYHQFGYAPMGGLGGLLLLLIILHLCGLF
jgi:hypothetical protein